ncbi:MAG: BamA/TamA family outer membrane protein [Prevotella sp.]|uniref:translocation and assembly module lipoprotein TamL n=1 Tax=Prevotella sp. TaxID=59823 RepID=UPI001CAEEBCF|nr:BamA/TamA family outer membrane protein [Prevotella sp.]MBF1639214.1 BamA/TamA family outer membrane protein [Prevotella sp.]
MAFLFILVACSTTSAIPDGEQLYTGMEPTKYSNYKENQHFNDVKEELDLVLATKPNAAWLGSPSVRSPFPIGLWIWNAFSQDTTGLSRWLVRAFGSSPVLMSSTTPDLRVTVGENLLHKRGYFNGKISYEKLAQRNPKKMRLQYAVEMGRLWLLDSVQYTNFPPSADSLIRTNLDKAIIHKGDAFDVATLEQERKRITDLFRNNGYYYYQNNDASYLADTTKAYGLASVRLQMADSVSDKALRKWTIGTINFNLQRQFIDSLTQHKRFRDIIVNYNGSHMPLRLRAITNDLKIWPGTVYNNELFEKSQQQLNGSGIFSATNFTFTPRDTTDTCNVLDMTINCIFDKPYDFYIEAYGKGKTSGRYGPEAIIGLTKRNVFRGGEKLNLRIHGSYEWSASADDNGNDRLGLNNYEYGAEASLQFPRLVNPFVTPPRKRWEREERKTAEAAEKGLVYIPKGPRVYYTTPSTTLKASVDVLNRSKYFKRHVVSGELTYQWQPNERNSYSFSPLTLAYEYMHNVTDRYLELIDSVPYLEVSLADQFIPKMMFQHTFMSPAHYKSPIKIWTTVSEASNILSAGYAAFGRRWSEKDKKLFKNPFAQFVKIDANLTKVWSLGEKSGIAAHVNLGTLWAYGNSRIAPYTEQFYVGGANSIRAFNARQIGPGRYRSTQLRRSYVEQTGDIKIQLNLEYRPHLMGSLYGAVFLDAGNVWTMHYDEGRPEGLFKFKNILNEMALGTGVGLRYDIGYFMIRLDWGLGLHVPYETGKTGFYNISKFKDAQAFHLAIGLPF